MSASLTDDDDVDLGPDIDEAAVLRAMEGDKSFPLNSDEILTVIDRLHAKGLPDAQIAERIGGVSGSSVLHWRHRNPRSRVPLSLSVADRTGSASRPVPAPPVQSTIGQAEPTLDALVNAAARSTSKRTQALGVKLADLAGVVRDRLRAERDQAEKAEQEQRAREAAAAEVARLEAQLREARAKLRKRPAQQGGASSVSQPDRPRRVGPQHSAERMAALRAASYGEFPCSKGCGKVATTKAGQLSHERACRGAS